MDRGVKLFALGVWVFLAGCVSNYQYQARGEVSTVSGEQRDAVLYWHKDEGRLWYGKKYEQVDTSLHMRICEEIPKLFTLSEGGLLELPSKSGDIKVAHLNDVGNVVHLQVPEQLQEGSRCGLILLEGAPVGNDKLDEGMRPAVSILCKNQSKPQRYPVVANYPFNTVFRHKTSDERRVPDPCASR